MRYLTLIAVAALALCVTACSGGTGPLTQACAMFAEATAPDRNPGLAPPDIEIRGILQHQEGAVATPILAGWIAEFLNASQQNRLDIAKIIGLRVKIMRYCSPEVRPPTVHPGD